MKQKYTYIIPYNGICITIIIHNNTILLSTEIGNVCDYILDDIMNIRDCYEGYLYNNYYCPNNITFNVKTAKQSIKLMYNKDHQCYDNKTILSDYLYFTKLYYICVTYRKKIIKGLDNIFILDINNIIADYLSLQNVEKNIQIILKHNQYFDDVIYEMQNLCKLYIDHFKFNY